VKKAPETVFDILAEAAKEFVLDYTDKDILPAKKVLIDLEVVDVDAEEALVPPEEALDLRIVVQREEPSSEVNQQAVEKENEVGDTGESVDGVGSGKDIRQRYRTHLAARVARTHRMNL
jgi:hypothetical protein